MENSHKILLSSIAINSCLGILYTWNTFKSLIAFGEIPEIYKTLPYILMIFCFGFGMAPAGKMYSRHGGQKICKIAGFLVGFGMILCRLKPDIIGLSVGFGVMIGLAIPLGYSTTIQITGDCFPEKKRGTILGIITAALGGASIYSSILINFLYQNFGIETFTILGILYTTIIQVASCYLPKKTNNTAKKNFDCKQLLKNPKCMYLIYISFSSALAGLIITGSATSILTSLAGIETPKWSYILTSLISLSSLSGRIFSGCLIDKLGIVKSALIFYGISIIALFTLPFTGRNISLIIFVFVVIGIGYGSTASLNPSYVYEFYGKEFFSDIFGLMFIGWALAGLFGPIFASFMKDTFHTFIPSIILTGIFMIGTIVSILKITKNEFTQLNYN